MRRLGGRAGKTHFNIVHFQLDLVVQDDVELVQSRDALHGVLGTRAPFLTLASMKRLSVWKIMRAVSVMFFTRREKKFVATFTFYFFFLP